MAAMAFIVKDIRFLYFGIIKQLEKVNLKTPTIYSIDKKSLNFKLYIMSFLCWPSDPGVWSSLNLNAMR